VVAEKSTNAVAALNRICRSSGDSAEFGDAHDLMRFLMEGSGLEQKVPGTAYLIIQKEEGPDKNVRPLSVPASNFSQATPWSGLPDNSLTPTRSAVWPGCRFFQRHRLTP